MSRFFQIARCGDSLVVLASNGTPWFEDFLLCDHDEVRLIMSACAQHLENLTHDDINDTNESRLKSSEEGFRQRVDSVKKQILHRRRRMPEDGYIYLMRNERNGFTKVGWSTDPRFREKTLQSEEPEVRLIHKFSGPIDLEKRIHKAYSEKRVRGEWFDLTSEDIAGIRFLACERKEVRNGS